MALKFSPNLVTGLPKSRFFRFTAIFLTSIITLAVLAGQFTPAIENQANHQPVIIWDLGDVALQTNRKKATPVVGLKNSIARFLAYKLLNRGFDPAETQKIMFEFMDWRRGNPPHTAAHHKDLPLPLDMREIMKGLITPTEMVTAVCADCERLSDYFVKYHNSKNSAREMVKGALRCLLPENLVEIQTVNPEVLQLIKVCKQTGNCRLLILSNWDKESCELLIASKPELFENFKREDITFSGETGFMKPEPEIYQHVIKKYNLNPVNCILIDDQPENIAGAQAAGWQRSFVYTDPEATKAELIKLGVLSANDEPNPAPASTTVN